MSQHNILIGITGSVAAKKAEILISLLKKKANIKAIVTYEGSKYIDEHNFKDIDLYFSWDDERKKPLHIELSRWADKFIIYPATANFISKINQGLADDLLTSTVLMYTERIMIFPAMHEEMYNNEIHQQNLESLLTQHDIYGPRYGKLDVGDTGLGRLLEPEEAIDIIYRSNDKNIFIISGPTKEYIDDIRYITNSSTGKQGYALAVESNSRGYNTIYISSTSSKKMITCDYYNFVNTADLLSLLDSIDMSSGYLFMPAAISDFTVTKRLRKLDRRAGDVKLILSPNIDIIKQIKERNPDLIVIGFAAELSTNVKDTKLLEKNIDYLVTNDVSNKSIGFGSDYNEVTIIDNENNSYKIPYSNKFIIAQEIMNYVIK